MANFWQKLPKPFLVLAPMEDVTEVVFREIVAGIARPDVFMTEFTSSDGLASKGREKTLTKFKFTKNQHPIVAQIWGKNTDSLFKAAETARDLEFDGIDINMGCPYRKIVKNGSCAGLIGNYSLAKEVITTIKSGAGNLPVSVKTRLGISSVITEEWIGFLLEQNLAAISIHARTAKQKSKVPADWNEIGKAVKLRNKISQNTVIVGNGDILSYKQALQMHKEHRVDGVMIGRGVFANPWVFKKTFVTKKRQQKEYINILIEHLNLFSKTWGNTKNFEIMKKFYKMYINDFHGASLLRQRLMETKNREEALAILSKLA